METRYKVGDTVLFKGRFYKVVSVMTHPDANWLYGLQSVDNPNDYKDSPVVFKHQLDDFYKENEQPRLL